jgi:hypothetical protein
MPLQVRHGPKEQLVMALTPEFVAQVTNAPNTTATVFEEQHALNDQQIRNTPQPRIRFAPRRCGAAYAQPADARRPVVHVPGGDRASRGPGRTCYQTLQQFAEAQKTQVLQFLDSL